MNQDRVYLLDIVIPVYNGEATLGGTIQRLLELPFPTDCNVRLIVCDDGSTDDTASLLARIQDERVHVVTLTSNCGRAIACNAAAAAGESDYLLFLDADCQPVDEAFIFVLAEYMQGGGDLVYGPIVGHAQDFWSAYHHRVEARRRSDACRGQHLRAMTTGNLLLRRDLFRQAGGFNEAYRRYGFEDKDLIVRLLEFGISPSFDDRAAVAHHSGNTIDGYCRKMYEVARYTSLQFASDHPSIYSEMSFGRLDPDLRSSVIAALMRALGKYLARPMVRIAGYAGARGYLPESLQLLLVQLAAALCFFSGAVDRRRD